MVSDREPRYQLLDSNGTVVGSLYEKSNGKLALQDGNTDTEVVFDGDTIGSGGESLDIDSLASGLKVLDLVDSASGNTVYDSSAEKLGDGNQNADINDLLVSDVQADSVSTGKVTNSDLNDGVDYLDPSWLAVSPDDFIVSRWDGDRVEEQTGGTGSITVNQPSVQIQTGGDQSSFASVGLRDLYWRSYGTVRGIKITVQFVDNPELFRFGVGDSGNFLDNVDSTSHFGIEYDGDLKFSWNGSSDSSQQTETVVSNYSLPTTRTTFRFVADSGGLEVFDDSGSLGTTASLTTGDLSDDEMDSVELYHSNPDSATDNRIDTHTAKVFLR